MKFELHGFDGTEVEGYRLCKCGVLVLAEIFEMRQGRCQRCYDAGETRNVRVVEVVHRGRVASLKIPGPPKPKNRGSRGSPRTKQVRKHAERAALKRLRALFPDIYQLLYEEERLARGLPVIRRSSEGNVDGDLDPLYAALARAGVDVASFTQDEPIHGQ